MQFLSSLRALDEINLSFTQQLQIIMNGILSPSNTTETTDGEKDQIEAESGQENLMDRVVKAVNVARQDTFPYLQHPGKIIYLKQKVTDSQEGDGSHVALALDSLRAPQSLPLLARMLTDHRDNTYRLAVQSVQAQDAWRGMEALKKVLN